MQAGEARGEELSKERIAEVDEKYDSPRERAEEIFTIFQLASDELDHEWTRYDLLCFCVQFLGMMSLGDLQPDEDLRLLAKNLNRWLHERHYFHAEKIFGEGQ